MYCSIMPKLKHSFILNAKHSFLLSREINGYTKAMLKSENDQEEEYGDGVGKRIKEALDSIPRGGRGPLLDRCINRKGGKGISAQALTGWVKNGRISTYNLSILSNVTGFTLDYLIHNKLPKRITDNPVMEHSNSSSDKTKKISSTMGDYAVTPVKEIPLFTPDQAKQWMETFYSGEYKRMPIQKLGKIAFTDKMFYVDVIGDANYPEFKHGEVALIDPERMPENENFVLVEISGDVSIRQYTREAGDCWLTAMNPNYPPKPLESATVIGVVLASHETPNIKYHV